MHDRSWHHHALRYGLLGLGVGLFVTVGYRLGYGSVPNALLPIVAGVAVSAGGLILDRVLGGRLTRRFVALTPAGVAVGTRRPMRLVSWEDVLRVSSRGSTPRLQIRGEGVTTPLEDVFENQEEVRSFRQAVNARRRRAVGLADE